MYTIVYMYTCITPLPMRVPDPHACFIIRDGITEEVDGERCTIEPRPPVLAGDAQVSLVQADIVVSTAAASQS